MSTKNKKESTTQIILLGTGTPNAEPDRSGPSIAIIVNKTPYLIDFGPGIIRRAVAANIDLTKLKLAFLTHLHSDSWFRYRGYYLRRG
ncbi:MAG: hypothetical protein ACTSPI_16410 [Candidatus Heimdallarchaeaceae archaeon]